jgi:hypothetical protein
MGFLLTPDRTVRLRILLSAALYGVVLEEKARLLL